MKAPVSTAVAIGVGGVILLGYFLPVPYLTNLRLLLLQWAVFLAAAALFVAALNLSQHHWVRLTNRHEAGTSGLLLIALWGSFVLGLVYPLHSAAVRGLFRFLILPIGVALLGVLTVSLIYAALQMMRRRPGLFSVLFLTTAMLILLGATALPGIGPIPFLSDTLRPWLAQVPAAAGARGILLGVALGTVATGLRILLGSDRPYGE